MKPILLISAALIGAASFAQRPSPPPEGDIAPAPLPMEGKKSMEPVPSAPRGREKPTTRKALPRPPVKPPTPDPNKVDPIQ